MYINELPEGIDVIINTCIGKEKMEFTTKTLSMDQKAFGKIGYGEHVRVVAPIQIDGKTVGFPPGYEYKVIATHEDVPYLWTQVAIILLSIPGSGEKIHVIVSDQDAKKYNRRNSFRQWVGAEGKAQINNQMVEIVVKDISSTGISIVLKKEYGIPESGELVHIVFEDASFDIRFSLIAEVVRCIELDGLRSIIGCKLKNPSSAIEKYITQKQRNAMRSGNAGPEKKDEK